MDGTPIRAPGPGLGRIPKRLLALRGDDQLVARLRAGDEAAFEVIFERHVPGVLSFCRHMLGDPDGAEDAVQHCFAAVHRELVPDGREIRLKPWLYTVARNRCLSMLRARREQAGPEPEVATAGLLAQVEQRADLRRMVADLQDLPPDQRAALVLTELGDLSHAEVAQVLDVQEPKVKGMVFRARSGLIERRDARAADCEEIRAELAVARKGGLRRGRLRHHLKACPGCAAYLEEVRRQRRAMLLILPVMPSLGLKPAVLAAVGLGGGGGAAAGGGLIAGGGLAAALPGGLATAAKVAAVALVATGAGVAGHTAIEGVKTDRGPALTPTVPSAGQGVGASKPAGSVTGPGRRQGGSAEGPKRARVRARGAPASTAPGRRHSATAPGHIKPGPGPAAGRGAAAGKPEPAAGRRLGQTKTRRTAARRHDANPPPHGGRTPKPLRVAPGKKTAD